MQVDNVREQCQFCRKYGPVTPCGCWKDICAECLKTHDCGKNPMMLRKYERVPIRVPLYVIQVGEIFQRMITLETRNISVGGMALETTRMVIPSSELIVMLSRLGGLSHDAQILGRVIYCREESRPGVWTIGVQFTEYVNTTPQQLHRRLIVLREGLSSH